MSFESLPTEILQTIFGYCSSRYDQNAISQVCHRWSDAVEYLLAPRMCLKVACETICYPSSSKDGSKIRTKTKLISKSALLSSTRRYTSFKVELCNGETKEIKKTLRELLDVCRERYQVDQLWLAGSPNLMLVQLFNRYHDWLQNLTCLDVLINPAEPRARVGQMITLPNLERLCWCEGRQKVSRNVLRSNNALLNGRNAFWLNAPKLSFLSVDLDSDNSARNLLKSCRKNPEVCHLFLPTLELKAGSELRYLDLNGVWNLNQRYIDGSEWILENLEQLMFTDCEGDVITRICDKCPNLRELTVIIYNEHSGSMPLQISPTLSTNLEILTIRNCSTVDDEDNVFVLYGPAVFSKLQYIYLYRIQSGLHQSASLDAPQLTKIDLDVTHFRQSILTHTTQLRTMGLQVLRWDEEELHPPANVTELNLFIPSDYVTESRLIEKYLECVPHLTRLKLSFERLYQRTLPGQDPWMLIKIGLAFVEALPKLEHLTICQATVRLADCTKLAGLKLLLLSHCAIETDPSVETPVVLTALEHVRVDQVTIEGIKNNDSFPIHVNEHQPQIEISDVSTNGMNVFSSKNFR